MSSPTLPASRTTQTVKMSSQCVTVEAGMFCSFLHVLCRSSSCQRDLLSAKRERAVSTQHAPRDSNDSKRPLLAPSLGLESVGTRDTYNATQYVTTSHRIATRSDDRYFNRFAVNKQRHPLSLCLWTNPLQRRLGGKELYHGYLCLPGLPLRHSLQGHHPAVKENSFLSATTILPERHPAQARQRRISEPLPCVWTRAVREKNNICRLKHHWCEKGARPQM